MKLALTGKGGTGKTTIAAGLGITFKNMGRRVILIDADPDSNLQTALGIKADITPLINLKSLIQERTGINTEGQAPLFRLNPKVDDIPERFFYRDGSLMLGIMGTVRGGGLGCTCPENAFLKSLLRHLILGRDDVVVLDMEAGIEHLGRGTASGIDYMLIICEPSEKSIETANRIQNLSQNLGIRKTAVIGNKISSEREKNFLLENLKKFNVIGFIPYYDGIRESDIDGMPFWEKSSEILNDIKNVIKNLEE